MLCQDLAWRFVTGELRWQARPFSLSALPRPPYLRATVKGLGEASRAVARLRPGTVVVIEGPYGAFTRHHSRTGGQFALVGAGVGITPLRAMLEDLPADADVTVLVRASTAEDLVHRGEITALVRLRHGRLHEILGPRENARFDVRAMRRLIPDVADRDVYVCGPAGFGAHVVNAAARLGTPPEQIHTEVFEF